MFTELFDCVCMQAGCVHLPHSVPCEVEVLDCSTPLRTVSSWASSTERLCQRVKTQCPLRASELGGCRYICNKRKTKGNAYCLPPYGRFHCKSCKAKRYPIRTCSAEHPELSMVLISIYRYSSELHTEMGTYCIHQEVFGCKLQIHAYLIYSNLCNFTACLTLVFQCVWQMNSLILDQLY